MLAQSSHLDPTFVLSSRVEAIFWMTIGAGFLIAAVRQRGVIRRDATIAACAFAIFAISDLVEATTGAWWRPWWLLVWKALCILALLALLIRHILHRRAQS